MFCNYSKLVTLYKMGQVHFCLLGMNGFHAKVEWKIYHWGLTLMSQSFLKMKISHRRLTDYMKKLHQKACPTCSKIIFPPSTKQSIDLWHCCCHCCYFLNSLQRRRQKQRDCKIITDSQTNFREIFFFFGNRMPIIIIIIIACHLSVNLLKVGGS